MKRGNVHFIGIGGIGVSALAQWYGKNGWHVSGSDLTRSEITNGLKKSGIRISIGRHRARNLPKTLDRVIYTAAVKSDNPELREAKKRKLPTRTYAQAVGEITRAKTPIAIAGAHGKSTTTALTALALIRGGLDPTVIVGTRLREFHDSNFRGGKSKYFLLEADEYRASFLNYSPAIAVITNIDREHLDYYKNIGNIERAFQKFLGNTRPRGIAVLNRDDARLRRIAARLRRKRPDIRIAWYSLKSPAAKRIRGLLKIPGTHNIANALAAYVTARALKIPERRIFRALAAYRGAWRRFQTVGHFAGTQVIADYAHHPTEIKATLQAAREKFPTRRIILVFQPHHFERTRDLFDEFVKAFDQCDELILLDVYGVAGRERASRDAEPLSRKLAEAIQRRGVAVTYLSKSARLHSFLRDRLDRNCLLLMMGAGSIWEMTKKLISAKFKIQDPK